MFVIGEALNGHFNIQARSIFHEKSCFDSLEGPAKRAIAFYESQCRACRSAVNTWTKVGFRLKVVKDVRKLIAQLIWDAKDEALYKK
jgi:hypothetical protein